MKGIGDLMKQASQMQEKMQEMQAQVAALEVTGESGAGLVRVTMNGRHEVKRVEIDPTLMSEEKVILEDLIAAACNDAARRVEAVQQEKLAGITAGLGLPFGKMSF